MIVSKDKLPISVYQVEENHEEKFDEILNYQQQKYNPFWYTHTIEYDIVDFDNEEYIEVLYYNIKRKWYTKLLGVDRHGD